LISGNTVPQLFNVGYVLLLGDWLSSDINFTYELYAGCEWALRQ
jgi:hypothetical protein